MPHRESNPHFSRPPRPQQEDYQQPPIPPAAPPKKHRGKQSRRGGAAPTHEEDASQHPRFPMAMPIPPVEYDDRVPLRTEQDHHSPLQPDHQPSILRAPLQDQSHRGASHKQPQGQGLRPGKSRVNFQEPSSKAGGPPVVPPPYIPPEFRQPATPRRQGGAIRLPKEQKSQPLTWMGACLCVIFWLVIIIGGLIVLIVYLVFRPQIPHFDVSGATLNAAYIDYGYLLNADITLLANFTNPNKKVHVDFSSVTIYLHYGNTLIATQYVEPFSAARVQSRFAYIHMVTSQVQLPLREAQRLMKQMESNGVLLDVRGVFRARSKLGTILRYSYNLYGHCSIMVARPPSGILLKKKCTTKR
ncbi:NDR1/HIN1-like protein 6 [Lotus japonicus]|uniref:NDR1/HIN1-like protein 6 n=1 Tax=Lotus japonicus TaxID=34305 RepID=UPI0025862766|nr:NDR1/HIN1-like protein 6 [Lotus japonicus]